MLFESTLSNLNIDLTCKVDRPNCYVWILTFCGVILFGILPGFLAGCFAVTLSLAYSSTKIVTKVENDTCVVYGTVNYITIDKILSGLMIIIFILTFIQAKNQFFQVRNTCRLYSEIARPILSSVIKICLKVPQLTCHM